jgi:hypothetical protein
MAREFGTTHVGGSLVTWARARFQFARLGVGNGRVHIITGAIVRWNFLGGTWHKPDLTFVTACGPQRHQVIPVTNPSPLEVCIRCENRARWDGERRG